MNDHETVLGIDLGGTHIRYAVVNLTGHFSKFHREFVDNAISGDMLVELIARRIKTSGVLSEVSAIGIALAGMVFQDNSIYPELVNIPGLGGYPLIEMLSELLGKPCLIGNDADLALRGEVHFGAAKGIKNVLLLTLGTGIGGGLLLDGRLRHGSHGSTVEIGRMMLGYPDDRYHQSIEALYAPGAIMKRLGDQKGLLFERIRQGDDKARQLADEMLEALALLIANVHLLLGLELVLVSGGLASAGDVLLTGLQTAFQRICPQEHKLDLRIELGALPVDTAGVIGAACLWFEQNGFLPSL